MNYPIIYKSTSVGRLSISSQGLYTFFQARCAMQPGYLRLWLTGHGKSYCLGLLMPAKGCLVLNRRLSRREMAALPRSIERAELGGKEPPLAQPVAQEERPSEEPPVAQWQPMPDGTMRKADNGGWLIAFPAKLRHPIGRTVNIDGREYLVFRW